MTEAILSSIQTLLPLLYPFEPYLFFHTPLLKSLTKMKNNEKKEKKENNNKKRKFAKEK